LKTENVIKEKAFAFAIKSIDLYKTLNKSNEYVFAKQFIRSATSVGANINEAKAGISKRDFVAKMSIASKESREAGYWLQLLDQSKLIDYDYSELIELSNELSRILTSIIKTSQTSLTSKI
jgi:four helix bundle protein